MNRLPNWRARLTVYVDNVRRRPFAYGQHDCALFAAGALEAISGEDLAQELRGTYADLPSGRAAIQRMGYLDAIDMAKANLSRVPRHSLQVGDLAVVETPEGAALGVVQGGAVFLVGQSGMMHVDMLDRRVRFGLRV